MPTKEEEALWTQRVAGDCASLKDYLVRFQKGAFAEEAGRMLQAAEIVEEESWIAQEHPLPLTVRATLAPLASEKAAREDALSRGESEAKQICQPFKVGEFRLVSVAAKPQTWRCSARGSEWGCSFDGQAVCRVEARRVTQRQVCK